MTFNFKTLKRLYRTIHLFDKEEIRYNFRNMDKIYDVKRIKATANKSRLKKSLTYRLPHTFPFNEENINTRDFLDDTQLEALLIIHNDKLIYEDYCLGLKPTDKHISWSVTKSFVSTLMGIAWDEGLFKLDDPITKYLPQFIDTGYDKVIIKDILQMSSGIGFNEDYANPFSDINRLGRAFALGSSVEEFTRSLKREREPGTFCNYVSMDTQVLGILLTKITGKSLTEYIEEKLWIPLRMEDNASWIIDAMQMEMAFGGLNISARDFAKLGQLYLKKGKVGDRQILSEKWIDMALTPDEPHLKPGNHNLSNHIHGYGFLWWIPAIDEGDFFAAGVYDQYVYVQPASNIVIVVISANYHYQNRQHGGKRKHVALFKKIAEQLA